MADLIERQVAIDAMCDACSDWCDEGVCKKVSAIQKVPSAQPEKTCCGYDVKELIAFAIACRRAGVDEKDLKCFAQDCEFAWKVMQEEFNNAIKETLEKMVRGKREEKGD